MLIGCRNYTFAIIEKIKATRHNKNQQRITFFQRTFSGWPIATQTLVESNNNNNPFKLSRYVL